MLQDTDDALATVMALNHPKVNVLSVIPIFGNTGRQNGCWLWSQFLFA
jgi:inosine-uridine nucleoside N-ribohydrolase